MMLQLFLIVLLFEETSIAEECVPPWAELAERLAVTSLQQRGGSTSCVVHIRAPAGHLVALNVTRLAAHGRAAPAAAPLVPQQHAPPLPPGLHVHASPAPSGPPAPYLPPGVASDVTTTPRAACALPWLEVRDGFPDGEGPPSASPRLLRICSERPASAGAPAAPSAAAPFRSVLSSRSELTLEFQWAGASATEGSVAAAEFQATVTFTECKFRCRDGQCVSSSLMRCDGASQCADASDEEGCSPGTDQPSHRSLQAGVEFVQILVIVSVAVVMVLVITCILNHYKISSSSFMGRHMHRRRRDHPCTGRSLCPSESPVPRQQSTSQLMYSSQSRDSIAACRPSQHQQHHQLQQQHHQLHHHHQHHHHQPQHSAMAGSGGGAPRDPFRRPPHQPLYPYSQVEIDLPPSISLSDGEEPPPYQGPCTLQLRPPEQQQEINRESVRAPPNRTVYDSDYYVAPPPCSALGVGGVGGAGPCPPSSHSGVSAASYGGHGGRMEGPPPTYSEVVGAAFPAAGPGSALFAPHGDVGIAGLLTDRKPGKGV
ncbi:uncharacterized protein LOC144946712 isoform X1 [Lampetra fluviatilis]